MDVLNKEQRRRNMQAIKNKDTKMERVLTKALWSKGYRYRKNDKTVFGKPDITFKKYKVAIFIDSEYFHGKDWEKNKYRIQTNQEFWWKKIERNMARDVIVINTLKQSGWKVIRFWTDEVRKNLANCVSTIEKSIEEKNGNKILKNKREVKY